MTGTGPPGFRLISVSFGRDGQVVSVTAAASPAVYEAIARTIRYPDRTPGRDGEIVTTFPVAVMLGLHGRCGDLRGADSDYEALMPVYRNLDRVIGAWMPEQGR